MKRASGGGLVLGLWLPLLACGPWDLTALEQRYPDLAEVGAGPLAELTPYVIAMEDELIAFVCHWPRGSTLAVHVFGETDAADLELVERALEAWGGAGLGVDFTMGGPPADIHVRFQDAPGGRSGVAAVDCLAREGARERLTASLARAQVTLRREALNWKGQRVALAEDERLGAALHEFGHALGFQGHPQRGESVMVRSVDHVRWVGRGVLAGRPFQDEALSALYALPTGAVLGRVSLPEGRSRSMDAARRSASGAGPETWWIRVGDRSGRLHFGPGSPRFSIPDVKQVFKFPELFRATASSDF